MLNSNRRVLIPASDPAFLLGMIAAYELLGFEVTTGTEAFVEQRGEFDVIHFMWPEAFSYGREPASNFLDDFEKKVHYWRNRSQMIASVNNHYPHGFTGNRAYHRLYSIVYSNCNVIHHFSESSRQMTIESWPEIRHAKHLVTHPVNYQHLLRNDVDRKTVREQFGFADRDFVILIFGAVRNWREAILIFRALTLHSIRDIKVLNATRYLRRARSISSLGCKIAWTLWSRVKTFYQGGNFIPEEDVHRYFLACDGVIIPRIESLSSGVPLLAMTFGKCIIAPENGAFRDYLAGTDNLFYTPGDARTLRRSIETLYTSNRDEIGKTNFNIARNWTWESLIENCIAAIDNCKS